MLRPNRPYCPHSVRIQMSFHLQDRALQRTISAGWTVPHFIYTSPYMVATPKGYTKHYYAESERVASRIGGGLDSVDMFIRNIEEFIDKPMVEISPLWTDDYHEEFFDEKRDHNLDHLYHAMECTENAPSVVYECLIILHKYSDFPHHEYEPDCYWYHPDHLGSSSWITFSDGKAVQHLHYLPWGENFVDQRTSSFSSMYTFSAKEKDTETGYSYFGSRYYNSDLSIWLSVDPMSDKYPSMSPYVYCANNPVKLVDPNGMEVINPYKKMIETAKKDISNAKIRLSNLQRGTPEYKSEKQQLQAARKDKRTAMSNYMTVLMAIKEVKQYNKELYDRMNNLTDQTGAPVDVFVTVDEKLGAGKAGQCTNNWQNGHFSLFDLDNRISSSNGVKVSLNPTASSDMGLTLSHEFGHLDYIVPNIITYNKWLIDNELNRSSYDGHSENPLDLSGVSARDAEKTHIRNRRGF